MNTRRVALVVVSSVAFAGGYAALAEEAKPAHATTRPAKNVHLEKTLLEMAGGPNMPGLSRFVAALKAAGVDDILKGDGPFTIFAPTNDAFDKLGKEKLDFLMKPENQDILRETLLLHVHPGEAVRTADFKSGPFATINGRNVKLTVDGEKVTVNNATVTKTEVVCKNGVIHHVDAIIEPVMDGQ